MSLANEFLGLEAKRPLTYGLKGCKDHKLKSGFGNV